MQEAFLVTGASKGIGRSIALAIANSGHAVIALARESSELNDIILKLKSLNSQSIAIPCDLGNSSDIIQASKIISENFEHLSGIIHNAGTIHPIANMMDVERSEWERSIQVNLIGVQDLTNRLDPFLGGDKHSRITTISSGAAKRSLHGWSAYCVAKAGLDMWAMCMAEEGEKGNISALAIAPGIVDTEMQNDIRNANQSAFPSLPNFIDYHKNGDLTNPDDVAQKLLPYCLGISGENGQRLDVRNL